MNKYGNKTLIGATLVAAFLLGVGAQLAPARQPALAAVDDDGVEVGRQAGTMRVAGARAPQAQKGLLHHVLGVLAPAQQLHGQGVGLGA